MSLAEDGTRASVIDSDEQGVRGVRLFDLDARTQLGEYSPSGRNVVTSAIDPVTGRGRVQRDIRPLLPTPCDSGRTGTLDLADAGRSGVTTYEGVDRAAADVEFSVDGSLFAALAPTPQLGGVALWWGAKGNLTGPIFLDLDVIFPDPSSEPGLQLQCREVLSGRLADVCQRIQNDHRS